MSRLSPASESAAPREEPLRDLNVEKTFHVEDYGAKADDGADDLAGIQAAMTAAAQCGAAAEVAFGEGRYDLNPSGKGGLALAVNGAKDLVIDGHGAEIVIHNPQKGFLRLSVSERVIVRNLSIDYDPRPVTQGWVKSVDAADHSLVVELSPGFPSIEEEYFRTGTHRWAVIKDKENPRRPKRGLPNVANLEDWRKEGERTFRVQFAKWYPIDRVSPGDPYVQIARDNGAPVFCPIYCSRCTFADIRIFSAPAVSYVPLQCSLLNFLRCRTVPRDEMWHGTGADGIYCVMNRIGPWIEGCEFDAIGDDCLIFKTKGANCVRKIDDRTLVLQPRPDVKGLAGAFPVQPDDTLRVYDPMAGQLIGEAKVVSAENEQAKRFPALGTPWTVVIDRDLPGVQPGTEWGSPIFYNDDTVGAGFVVRDTIVRNVRRWGVLCESHDGVIENNQFEGTCAQAILFINADVGLYDSDGFASRNIAVRGNTFRDCFVADPRGLVEFSGVVASVMTGIIGRKESQLQQAKVVPWQGNQNLLFENNRFFGWRGMPALNLGCVSGAQVRDNTFELGEVAAGQTPSPAIRVYNASDVDIQGNRIEGWPGDSGQAIVVDEGSTQRVTMEGNTSAHAGGQEVTPATGPIG
ncbi:MAG: right-handed parallel beta-helix repeat-containing protein [Candidatus Sumerlaeota bacterium]|nr:right-handed parallel beta-helix repeat-containing protein [Candidatus Sumerlaeota bacterium]